MASKHKPRQERSKGPSKNVGIFSGFMKNVSSGLSWHVPARLARHSKVASLQVVQLSLKGTRMFLEDFERAQMKRGKQGAKAELNLVEMAKLREGISSFFTRFYSVEFHPAHKAELSAFRKKYGNPDSLGVQELQALELILDRISAEHEKALAGKDGMVLKTA